MSVATFLNLISAIVISVGGTTVLILALAKWFGGFISSRLLDKYNNKHESELEELKSRYVKELENTRHELKKAQALFLRYSERQFELYNNLWRTLQQTKRQADTLWAEPNTQNLLAFAQLVIISRNAVDDSQLMIEEDHYNQLDSLLRQFESFKVGKTYLADPRLLDTDITQRQLNKIVGNRQIKAEYDLLMKELSKSFRKQIKQG